MSGQMDRLSSTQTGVSTSQTISILKRTCVEVFGDGTWNDVSCGEMRHFGCKISVGKSSKLSLLCSLLCRVYMLDKDVKQLPTFFAPYGRRSSYLSLY